ncbi:prolyl 4-Hydroxylase alpha-subunit, region [Onchocerca flexuosa]|uniref:Prolyl 4-Hydroxylase alpha-subunit, region n=1 Tax=Onchocerca flexuosa TaxID=387005 RepID=A0A238BMJ3_9BILA|nr:prolyl 4-Hydroxylase alpha-subunit, region [Onchocerca flexuosa]
MELRRVINIFLFIAGISAEFYSCLDSLRAIIRVEKDIPLMINGYMKKELGRLDYLRKFAQEVKERNDKAIRDDGEAIRHQVNDFLLIKEMITDWNKVVKIMRLNSANDVIRNFTREKVIKRINYPTEKDHEL